jgi:hypothetical protein
MTVYALIVMIGSVHLGWHYAVDGYLGAAGMLVLWWGLGKIPDRTAARRNDTIAADTA